MAYAPVQLKRIKDGLCIDCGHHADGRRRCQACYERGRNNLRAWRENNPEKVREYSRQWRKDNAEQVRAADRARYKSDPDGRKMHVARWRKEHPDVVREYSRQQKAKLKTMRPPRTVMTENQRSAARRESQRRYRAANADKCREYQRRYRASHEAQRVKTIARAKAWRSQHKERFRAVTEAWRKANPSKVAASRNKYAKNNRQKRREWERRYFLQHRDEIYKRGELWRRRNKSMISRRRAERYHANLQESRRKALAVKLKRSGVTGHHTTKQWMDRVGYFNWCCRYCAVELTPQSLRKDHFIPLCKGGTNWPSNLVPACASCNSKKGGRHPRQFLKSMAAS